MSSGTNQKTNNEQQVDDEIAKWRAERRANYPSANRSKDKDTDKEPNKPVKSKPSTHRQLTLHDKMFLTDVHKEEERIIQCLKMLMEEKN